MKLAYQYRLIPTAQQTAEMNRWLDMLRLQYNWMLALRFQWWEENRFHFETARKILSKADVVFVEDLKVKNLSKRAKPKQDEVNLSAK